MARVLAVGIATLDIINEVDRYPGEDAEVRAVAHSVRRGGNATNTLVVLSQLGHDCDWAGVLVDAPGAGVVREELSRYRIQTRFCRHLAHGMLPTSYITLSRETGSRTIVHYRDLPEYDREAFARIPLAAFDWVHFEGRNVDEVLPMMQALRTGAGDVPVSLEVEKPRAGIERLFPFADLIVFSQAYAESRDLSPTALLEQVAELAPRPALVCTLGEVGAIALTREREPLKVAASRPRAVVDTLGAGDTFNAGLIDALLAGEPLDTALRRAAALAGVKCGQAGLHHLGDTGDSGDGDG